MATLVGNNGAVSINGKAVAAVRNFSIDITADTIETTTMGIEARTYVKGLSSFSGSADIFWDTADWDSSGENTTWNPTDGSSLVGASGVAGKFYLDLAPGVSAADKVFTGTVIVTGYTINSSFDGMVEASISFQGSDAVTYSTSDTTYP
jgi:predicted secreted protein